jgi:hypothetical protein
VFITYRKKFTEAAILPLGQLMEHWRPRTKTAVIVEDEMLEVLAKEYNGGYIACVTAEFGPSHFANNIFSKQNKRKCFS